MKTLIEFLYEAKSNQNPSTDFLKLLKLYGGTKSLEKKTPLGKQTVYELCGKTKNSKNFCLTIKREPAINQKVQYVYYISNLTLEGDKQNIGHKEYFLEDTNLLRKFELLFKTLQNISSKDLTNTVKNFILTKANAL